MEPFSCLLTFAWEGSLVDECSLNCGLNHLTWKWSVPNAMWCLRNWIFTETELSERCRWISELTLWFFFPFLSLLFYWCPLPIFSSHLLSSHSYFFFHPLFSIFLFLFVLSRPLPSRPLSFCWRAHFLSTSTSSCFHTLSLSGGCFGPRDLWPPVSERVCVIRGRSRKWKWRRGVR